MRYFGSVVSFVLLDRERAEQFLKSCKLLFEATSFGGVHTTAERRARWGVTRYQKDLFALVSDSLDLIDDIAQALDAVLNQTPIPQTFMEHVRASIELVSS